MPHLSHGCIVPTNAELNALQMELFPQYLEGRLGFDIMPFKTTDKSTIVLFQPDIFRGKQAHRGLGKPTLSVPKQHNPFGTFCEIQPSYWGEHTEINEEMMTRWGNPTQCGDTFDTTDFITLLQQWLLQRRAVLMEYNIWQSLVFGRYTALNSSGQVIHQSEFNIQNVTAGVPWTNFAGSFPLRDFRAIQLLGRGTSARFDTCAKAYMNRETANLLFANTNPLDVGRIGLSACCDFMSLDRINQQFAAQGLPQLVIYDNGWIDDTGVFNVFIPFGYVVIVGCRPNNVPVGHYWLTRNAASCSITSGPVQKLLDTCDREASRKITVVDLHNGTPVIEYSRMVVVLRVI